MKQQCTKSSNYDERRKIENIWQLIGFTSLGVCCRGFESHQNIKSSVAQLVEHRFNPIISPKGCRQLLLLTLNLVYLSGKISRHYLKYSRKRCGHERGIQGLFV